MVDRATDSTSIAPFLEDAAHVPGGFASEVAFPRTEQDVADIVHTARTVLPVGAQSSLTGGATPRGEVVLSTARMRWLEIGAGARARAGAGVTLVDVGARLRTHDALYPPAPTFLGATVGGTLSTNAAGAATFKYGTTRTWVDELTVVLANGEVLDLRRGECVAHPDGYFDIEFARGVVKLPVPRYRMPDVPKLSAGYFAAPGMDLIDLFIGSEGTLGIITEATLRSVSPAPAACLVFVTFDDASRALAFVDALRSESQQTWREKRAQGLDISAIEHMDARSLALLREDGVDKRLGVSLDERAVIGLLITLDLPPGTSASEVYEAFGSSDDAAADASPVARFVRLLSACGAVDDALVAPPGDAAGVERLIALREAVPVAVNARVGVARRDIDARIEKTAADVIVPFERFASWLAFCEEEWRARGLLGAIWGHISDGNVHPNVIPRSYADVVSGKEAMLAFGREAIRLGGAPLAEHGVGRNLVKQQLLVELYGAEGIDDMRAVKRAIDPEWKLAPGVLFPAS